MECNTITIITLSIENNGKKIKKIYIFNLKSKNVLISNNTQNP